MMTLLVILFYVGAVVMAAVIIFGMMDTHMMPLACPHCYHGSDENIAGEHRPWFERHREDRARCRWCGTWFHEHPNGSLVEDRD
jgi:hypothetical protein